jgi:CheY-like chemotaxis protein
VVLIPPEVGKVLSGKSILVVDDEEDIRLIVSMILKSAGAKVQEVNSGNAALQLENCFDFDLILSDVRMNDGDGIALLKAVRAKSKRSIAFIFLTGGTEVSETEMLSMGAQALIEKPFTASELLKAVAAAIQTLDSFLT